MARPPLGSRVWLALATVYVVWGSTYLGIDLAIRTIPPFLMAATRFLIAGALLYAWAIRRGDRSDRPTARHWLSAFLIATPMLAIGNAAVGWAEETVDTGHRVADHRVCSALDGTARPGRLRAAARALDVIGLVVGFAARRPASRGPGGAGGRAFVLVFTSLAWSIGSLYSRQAPLPRRPLVAVGDADARRRARPDRLRRLRRARSARSTSARSRSSRGSASRT